MMSADLWQRGCERLAAELPEQQFNTWIRPLPAAEVADLGDAGATVTVRVPNRFKLDWIRAQYAGRIETRAERAGRQAGAARASACAARRQRQAGTLLPPAPVRPWPRGARRGRGAAPASTARRSPRRCGTLPSRSRLNPALTFDTLVPGRANQMARTAALHVAGTPGQHVQPAVHLRRRRPGQDPPDARRRQRAAGRPARRPQFSTCTPSSSSPTWSRTTSARPSTSSRPSTTRSTCC